VGARDRTFDVPALSRAWLEPADPVAATPGVRYLMLVGSLALVLRLWRLDAMSLWVDEVFTWELVAPGRGFRFVPHILAAYQGPLYHAAVWPLVRLQDSAFLLRLPAAVAGVLAVPCLGVFTARLWGRQAGRLAALLLAVSPFAIWYSQEARGYSFLILFAVAAGIVLVDALRLGITRGRAVALALLGFGGLGSNFAFVFLLAAFALTVAAIARPQRPGQWLWWAIACGGGFVLAAPWLLEAAGIWEVGRVIPGTATGEALRGSTTFDPWALPFTGFALFYGFSLGPSLADLHGADPLAAVRANLPVIGAGVVAAAAALLPALARLDRRRWVVALWVVVPLLGVVLLAVRNVKPYNVRYAATVFPWLLALTAAGIGRYGRRGRAIVSVALLALCGASLAGYYGQDRYAKEDVRGAVAALDPREAPGRPILAPTVGPVVRHYWRGRGPVLGCWDEPQVRDAAMADRLVARQLGDHDSAWIVTARPWFQDPQRLLPDALARAGTLERIHDGPGVAVDLWRRRGDPGGAP